MGSHQTGDEGSKVTLTQTSPVTTGGNDEDVYHNLLERTEETS